MPVNVGGPEDNIPSVNQPLTRAANAQQKGNSSFDVGSRDTVAATRYRSSVTASASVNRFVIFATGKALLAKTIKAFRTSMAVVHPVYSGSCINTEAKVHSAPATVANDGHACQFTERMQ